MNIIESFAPTAPTLGSGFFLGVLIGYAVKKVIKLVVRNSWIILSCISRFTI